MFSLFSENDIFDETGKELGHIIWILCYFDEHGNPKQWLQELWVKEAQDRMPAKIEIGPMSADS